ncbi:hypothetical protein FHR92_002458 [Fontibacillus solani]|uniref:ParB/Sulfiredoxin domain-containing protein n=1 Tax=Fontibacillus solani TaxID=1572857 RepID=A0A7W3XRZ3_9BACL|nr:hypothetical protein [Fontibacillus solani]MBA9085986.1 hypothetical protein [Fontibacillus solani]
MEFGWPLPKRTSYLEELRKVDDPKKPRYPLVFQGDRQFYPIHKIPIGLPKYRLANGRTQASQESFLSKNSAQYPIDFFERDEENVQAQREQHNLLRELLGTNEKNIIKFFRDKDQIEPLILTHTGFVVNGNRRLCTFRELLNEDENEYQKFQHIEVIILDPCEEKDIDELEARLQIDTDIRADYNWISEACMLRNRHTKHGYTIDRLASIYGKSNSQIEDILDTLHHVDMYLENQGKSKQYEAVNKQEFAFKQLKKSRNKVKDPDKKAVFTSIAYTLLSNPTESGRLWGAIPAVEDNLDRIIAVLQDELDISKDIEMDDDIKLLDDEQSELESLIIALSDKDNSEQVIEVVDDVIREQKETERESKNQKYVLTQINKANTLLKNAIIGFGNETDTSGILPQLNELELSTAKLRELLDHANH